MTKLNIDRERLLAVIRYPQAGDPTAVSYAIAEAEQGHATEFIMFDPFSWEVEDRYHIPLAPGMILAGLQEGDVELLDVDSMDGVELYSGSEVEQADRSDYIPDDIAEKIKDSDSD
ncbi:hypothetical protein [Haloarcula sp. Atlit-7R]|uniref:hypothetical protein n=1 Tax=Haloarcula sp. Atlit-7R TaxID=2282125 RepID=UPI000EF1547C|nr:hypothetical protein [Haloarcula sp. Atlit-7R]RLM94406.1 hypothetical protein D3D01_16210 [Haloarcula sp. Atlit-7R]